MLKEVDADGSGAIDFDEFLALMSKSASDQFVEDQLHAAFNDFDQGVVQLLEVVRWVFFCVHPHWHVPGVSLGGRREWKSSALCKCLLHYST